MNLIYFTDYSTQSRYDYPASRITISPLAQASSLQDLAKSASLTERLHSSFKDSDFTAFEPRLQELLFGKLRNEIVSLRREERALTYIKSRTPYADLELYIGSNRLMCREGKFEHHSLEDDDTTFEENQRTSPTPSDPYAMQKFCREK